MRGTTGDPSRTGASGVRAELLHLADRLFGATDGAEPIAGRWLASYLALAGVLALVVIVRRPDAITAPQFWAEDGSVFFSEQLRLGFWPAVRRLHGGLPYLAARVVALLGSRVPTVDAPLVYTSGSIAITSLGLATFALPGLRHLVRSDAVRAIVCIAAICIPAGQDLLTVPCSLGYVLALCLLFLSLMTTPRTRLGTGAWCVGGMFAVFSAHAAPIALPLWLLRAARGLGRRRLREVCFAASQLAALALVFGAARRDWEATKAAGGVPFFDVQTGYVAGAFRALVPAAATAIDAAVLPASVVHALEAWGTLALVAPATVLCAAIALACRRLAPRGRITVVLASYVFVSSIALVLIGRPIIVRLIEGTVPELRGVDVLQAFGTRHRVLPHVALLLVAAALVDAAPRRRTRVATAVVSSAALLLAWAPQFRIPAYPDHRWPFWAAALDRKLASGSRGPLLIPLHPPPFVIAIDAPGSGAGDAERARDGPR